MPALCLSLASTAGQRSNPDRLAVHWQRLPRRVCRGTVGKTRRYFALKPPIADEADRTVVVRVDPGHSTDPGLVNSFGGVTAALKRAVELQPAAEGRSFQVVIDGERTRQSQGLMEGRFGCAKRRSRARSGM